MVLTSTHNLCFEQKYEKYQNFLSENVHVLMVKFSVYLNSNVFVMCFVGSHLQRLILAPAIFSVIYDFVYCKGNEVKPVLSKHLREN